MRFLSLFLLLLLCSCGTTNRFLKVGSAKLTPFFEQPEIARDGRKQVGFQKIWTTPDRQVLEQSLTKKKLFIAPVILDHLRPAGKALARQQIAAGGIKRHEHEVASRLHQEFVDAFKRSPAPIFQLVDKPGNDTVVLQLALTELTPTSAQGNVITTVLKVVVTPLAFVGNFFTKGNIAIEGKLLVPMPRGSHPPYRPFFQFADKEGDKFTFFNIRDYQPYGHAVHTIRDWAVHFEQVTRARGGETVKDSSAVTLRLY